MMLDKRVMDIDELKAFLASSEVFTFKVTSREEIYAWIERTEYAKLAQEKKIKLFRSFSKPGILT